MNLFKIFCTSCAFLWGTLQNVSHIDHFWFFSTSKIKRLKIQRQNHPIKIQFGQADVFFIAVVHQPVCVFLYLDSTSVWSFYELETCLMLLHQSMWCHYLKHPHSYAKICRFFVASRALQMEKSLNISPRLEKIQIVWKLKNCLLFSHLLTSKQTRFRKGLCLFRLDYFLKCFILKSQCRRMAERLLQWDHLKFHLELLPFCFDFFVISVIFWYSLILIKRKLRYIN